MYRTLHGGITATTGQPDTTVLSAIGIAIRPCLSG